MEIVEVVILVLAYTLGIITLFLELICFKRNLEYLETIFLTASFLLLIVAVTVSRFFGDATDSAILQSDLIVHVPVILLGLSTVFNTLIERKTYPKFWVKPLFVVGFSILLVLIFIEHFSGTNLYMSNIVMFYLIIAVSYSMIIIRTTKPKARTAHREHIERITALVCLIVLPLTLFLDLMANEIEFLSSIESKMGLTLPLLFIFLAGGKFLDDVQRLSLFSSGTIVKEQNIQNYQFTPREIEVVELIVKGCTYNQIAESLFISMPTVKTHISNIYKKAQVNNKIELLNLLMV